MTPFRLLLIIVNLTNYFVKSYVRTSEENIGRYFKHAHGVFTVNQNAHTNYHGILTPDRLAPRTPGCFILMVATHAIIVTLHAQYVYLESHTRNDGPS